MHRPRSRVNIRDVAREAGVSVSTVSRVLNGKDDVASDTEARVQRVINELGYASDMAARSLRTHKTNVLGLIVPHLWQPFLTMVIKGVSHVAESEGYDLLAYASTPRNDHSLPEWEQRLVAQLNGSVTDGIIVVTPMAATYRTTSPVVAVDPLQQSTDFPAVISTNFQGVLEAMDYLVSLGHRRIGYIGGRSDLLSAQRRLDGYLAGLERAGICVDPSLIQEGDYMREAGVKCAHRLLALESPPTAIFASSDETSFGVYDAAAERNLSIPDDLSVIGFDNTTESASMNPPLTTVDQSVEEMGNMAANIVLELIRGASWDVQLSKVPTKLVIRQSCRSVCTVS